MQTALMRGAWNVSLFWLWIMMANVMLHKCFSKDCSLSWLWFLSSNLFFFFFFFFLRILHILNAFQSKQVKRDCSQMLFFDALKLLVIVSCSEDQKFRVIYASSFYLGWSFVVVKCFRIKFMMNWVDFCLSHSRAVLQLCGLHILRCAFLTLSLGSWLTC